MSTICPNCADSKGWRIKGTCGWWNDKCSHCGENKSLCAERDYIKPNQRPVTIDDIYIYEANLEDGK
jgi:hypothetical protein